jgi:hypothetical protein
MKKILLILACSVFFCGPLTAFPTHMIILHGDVAYPGNSEVQEYFNPLTLTFNKDMRVFGGGLEYYYSFLGFLSAGAGVNYINKEYTIDILSNTDYFVYNAIQPYAVLKLFYSISKGFDLYAGANGGMIILNESKRIFNNVEAARYEGSAPAFMFFGGIAGKLQELWYMLEAGYKIAQIKPYSYNGSPGGTVKNIDSSEARTNFGGFYFGVNIGYGFGEDTPAEKPK